MAWVKLDDCFFRGKKAVQAGKDGRSLYLAGLCLCAFNLTDGHIATEDLPLLAAEAGVKPSVAKKLVEVGLWKATENGWLVPDYLEYNPSREEQLAKREAEKERKRKQREKGSANSTRGEDGGFVSRPESQWDNHQDNPPDNRGESPATRPPSPSVDRSSSSTSTLLGDDDEIASLPVNQALAELARRDLRKAESDGVKIRVRTRWLVTARQNRVLAGDGAVLQALAKDNPEAGAEDLLSLFDALEAPKKRDLCGSCTGGVIETQDDNGNWIARQCPCQRVSA